MKSETPAKHQQRRAKTVRRQAKARNTLSNHRKIAMSDSAVKRSCKSGRFPMVKEIGDSNPYYELGYN